MFHNNPIFKEREKGVSLIITFFILTIILAIVFSISILLYNGIKIIRNVGNSVVAFYAADSGVEKFFYYDMQQKPVGGQRGLCSIRETCPDNCTPGTDGGPGTCVESHCLESDYTIDPLYPTGCDPLICESCKVTFNSFFDGKRYTVSAEAKIVDGVVSTILKSTGIYKDVSRRIELQYENEMAATCTGVIFIDSARATPYCACFETEVDIEVKISPINKVNRTANPSTVYAIISNNIGEVAKEYLQFNGENPETGNETWLGKWIATSANPPGDYYVKIYTKDINNCDAEPFNAPPFNPGPCDCVLP